MNSTFVNLGKTNSDFPNNWYQSQGSFEYALWLQCYLIFHIRKGSFGLFGIFCSIVSDYAVWLQLCLIFHIRKDSIEILTFCSDNYLL